MSNVKIRPPRLSWTACWLRSVSLRWRPWDRRYASTPGVAATHSVPLCWGPGRTSCPDEEHCGLRMLMLDVRNAISNVLDRFTLADVVEVTLRKLRKDKVAFPFSLEPLLAQPASRSKSGKGAKKWNGQSPADKVSI